MTPTGGTRTATGRSWCAGAITFHTRDSGDLELGPGDRLEIDAGTEHSATVGPDGVDCAEAHLA